MEYMEQQMDNRIQSGINEREDMVAEIARLKSEQSTAINTKLNAVVSLIADSDIPRAEAKKLAADVREMMEGKL